MSLFFSLAPKYRRCYNGIGTKCSRICWCVLLFPVRFSYVNSIMFYINGSTLVVILCPSHALSFTLSLCLSVVLGKLWFGIFVWLLIWLLRSDFKWFYYELFTDKDAIFVVVVVVAAVWLLLFKLWLFLVWFGFFCFVNPFHSIMYIRICELQLWLWCIYSNYHLVFSFLFYYLFSVFVCLPIILVETKNSNENRSQRKFKRNRKTLNSVGFRLKQKAIKFDVINSGLYGLWLSFSLIICFFFVVSVFIYYFVQSKNVYWFNILEPMPVHYF